MRSLHCWGGTLSAGTCTVWLKAALSKRGAGASGFTLGSAAAITLRYNLRVAATWCLRWNPCALQVRAANISGRRGAMQTSYHTCSHFWMMYVHSANVYARPWRMRVSPCGTCWHYAQISH
jgi:hypothetical protein